jgi:hypothetical protein
MNSKGIWILTVLNILMFVGFLTGCGEQGNAAGPDPFDYDWKHPESFVWYGPPDGITWQNPRAIRFEDKNFIRIIAQDGTPFLIYGQAVLQGKKPETGPPK